MHFIDLHGHYAWQIDDGMPSLEDCKIALQKAKDDGIEKIVATPHVIPSKTTPQLLKAMKKRLLEFQELARTYDIEAYIGCEFFINDDYLDSLDQNIFFSIHQTPYLLVEFDVRENIQDDIEDRLHAIQIRDHLPIIAHIERYFHHGVDIERVQDLIDSGYIIQVNATSFLGVHGKTIKKNAYKLLNAGCIHIIASDTHRPSGRRSPCLLEAYQLLKKDYDQDILETLFYQNPLHIIRNEAVEIIDRQPTWFEKLFKK